MLSQVFNLQLGLTSVGEKGKMSLVQSLLQPTNGAYYKRSLLLPKLWYDKVLRDTMPFEYIQTCIDLNSNPQSGLLYNL